MSDEDRKDWEYKVLGNVVSKFAPLNKDNGIVRCQRIIVEEGRAIDLPVRFPAKKDDAND